MADDPKPAVDPTENVRELVEAETKRQDDMRQALADRLDTKIDGHMCSTRERHENMMRELDNIEARRIEHKSDTEKAVNAAFEAAKELMKEQAASSKEAIGKSEKAAGDQLKSLESVVDDLKQRLGVVIAQLQTRTEVRVDSRSNTGVIIAALSTAGGFLMLAAVIIIAVLRGAG